MRPTGLEGRIVVVTGALGGIGRAICRAALDEGMRVVATDVNVADGTSLADGHRADALRVETLDVRDGRAVDAMIDRVEAEWGPVDCGVNAAGVLATGLATDLSADEWQRLFDVNVTGVFNVSRALARVMAPRGRGAIVTVGSNAGGLPRHGMAAYGASKAAAMLFTRSLGLELAASGIRCNVVAPGSTRTPMLAPVLDAGGEEALIAGDLAIYKNGIPLRKLAEPRDIADAVLFLLSDRASHITMGSLYVDGGAALHE